MVLRFSHQQDTMIFFVILGCIVISVSGQFFPEGMTTDEFLKSINLKVDKNCSKHKILDYEQIITEASDNCIHDFQKTLISPLTEENKAVDKLVTNFCVKYDSAKCIDFITEKLKPCLSEAQLNIIHQKNASDHAILKFICEDDGKVLKELNLNVNCTVFPEDQQRCANIGMVVQEFKPEEFYKEEYCRKIIEISNCAADVTMKSCQDIRLYNFVKNMTTVGIKATPCEKYVGGSSKINFNLLLMVLAPFFIFIL